MKKLVALSAAAAITMVSIPTTAQTAPPTAAANGQTAKQSASAMEIALLPHFCWNQYMANPPAGPEFQIHDCGPGMNHYCPALVQLIRAKRVVGDKNKKRNMLEGAKKGTLYTLDWLKDYPACPIRAHVEKTLAEIDGLLSVTR